MQTVTERKPNTFFLEMILAIAFLALAAGVLVQLFVGAHLASVQSDDLGKAVMLTQNAADCYKAADAQPEELAALLGGQAQQDTVTVHYAQDLTVAGQPDAYRMEVAFGPDGALREASIRFFKSDGELVYELEVALYRPRQADAHRSIAQRMANAQRGAAL